jgi:hypothetical protein
MIMDTPALWGQSGLTIVMLTILSTLQHTIVLITTKPLQDHLAEH